MTTGFDILENVKKTVIVLTKDIERSLKCKGANNLDRLCEPIDLVVSEAKDSDSL